MTAIVDYILRRELGKSFDSNEVRFAEHFTTWRHSEPLLAETSTDSRSTYLLRLNPSYDLVAAAHGNQKIAIYSASSGALAAVCEGHTSSPWTLNFHPAHPYLLVSGCLGGSIHLWDLDCLANFDYSECNGKNNSLKISPTRSWKRGGAIASLVFHPHHPIIVAAWSQEVVFLDWVSGRTLSVWRFVSDHSRVRWVKFSPNGDLLYTATANPSGHHSCNMTSSVSSRTLSKIKIRDQATSETPGETRRIPRHALLGFLVSQPTSWYLRLGVCQSCSLRLCRWAGTLGPVFPSLATEAQRGLALARQAARIKATAIQLNPPETHAAMPYHIAQLIEKCDGIPECLRNDAFPAAVAIIEDLPAKEFLLSRGSYCSSGGGSSTGTSLSFCCGGHACDLVLTHRELMRHSLCRSCLDAFWQWANHWVDWWTWTAGLGPKSSKQCSSIFAPHTESALPVANIQDGHQCQVQALENLLASGSLLGAQSTMNCVGICLQCRAGISLSSQILTGSPIFSQNNFPHDLTLGEFLPRSASGSISPHPSNSNVAILCPSSLNKHVSIHNNFGLCLTNGQSHLPMAALNLIRSRLLFADGLSAITYASPRIVNDSLLVDHLRKLLSSDLMDSRLPERSASFYKSFQTHLHVSLNDVPFGVGEFNLSPSPKRRKLTSSRLIDPSTPVSSTDHEKEEGFTDNFILPNSPDAYFSSSCDDDPFNAVTLMHDASTLAQTINYNLTYHSTHRTAVINRKGYASIFDSHLKYYHLPSLPPPSRLFPYVALGAKLLHPDLTQHMPFGKETLDSNGDSHCISFPDLSLPFSRINNCTFKSPNNVNFSNKLDHVQFTGPPVEPALPSSVANTGLMTACCRCGRIVPHTFPVDPRSSLSDLVTTNLVLAGTGRPLSIASSSTRPSSLCSRLASAGTSHIPNNLASSSFSNSNLSTANSQAHLGLSVVSATASSPSGLNRNIFDDASGSASIIATSLPNRSSTPGNNASDVRSGMMYLINRTGSDTPLSRMHQSITEVIAGLFVEMGEHSSASSLTDTTYRICRWELNLCGPVSSSNSDDTISSKITFDFPSNYNSVSSWPTGSCFLPMPANVAVSYNTNSLVVPHARLFNDSSICLSPDGRLLAAFVVPRVDINATGTIEDLRNPDSRRSSLVIGGSSESETLLAVYRLEPRKNRGACLFSHRFASVSPVCLDFSPLADYIVVGLATTRLPCLNRSPTGHADISNSQHASMNSSHSKHYRTEFTKPGDSTPASMTSVARIFHLDRRLCHSSSFQSTGNKRNFIPKVSLVSSGHCSVQYVLNEVVSIPHPFLLSPISSTLGNNLQQQDEASIDFSTNRKVNPWHLLQLSAPGGISVNSVAWNPRGGIIYGTTKGLVVFMRLQPIPLDISASDHAFQPESCSVSDSQGSSFSHNICRICT